MDSVAALQEQLVAIRRHLHRYPELSGEEWETTRYIREQLEAAEIRILSAAGLATGIIAEIGHSGPVIALRADIDALPVQEQTDLPYASTIAGKMHACGHDFHSAALLGAAYLLKKKEDILPGRVRLIFQPAEEKANGARQIIDHGGLEDVQVIYGLHNKPDLPVGTIGIKDGPLMAAADGFRIRIHGQSTHAAVPEAGIDPIIVSAHIITALQSIISRNISAQESAVVSVTRLHSGHTWNVIPEQAELEGTIRTFDESVRREVLERFSRIIEHTAAAYGAKADIQMLAGPPPVHNDKEWTEAARRSARQLGLNVIVPTVSPASEDFSFYQQQVAGVFLFVGTSGPQEWHHPAFDVDEEALGHTAALLAETAQSAMQQWHETASTAIPAK